MAPALPPGPPEDPGGAPPRPPALHLVPRPAPAAAPPPPVPPLTGREVRLFHAAGAVDGATLEPLLVLLARADAVLDLALGEAWGVYLGQGESGERPVRWTGYPAEVLHGLARLADLMTVRPLLREALRTGAVRKAPALAVLALAVGRHEARWVDAARRLAPAALRQEVARARAAGARGCCDDPDCCCMLLEARAARRAVRELERTPWQPPAPAGDASRPGLLASVPEVEPAAARSRVNEEARRWERLLGAALPPEGLPPGLPWSALHARLAALLSARGRHRELLQACAAAVLEEESWRACGFPSLGRYCDERLRLPASALRRAAALEPRRRRPPPPAGEAPPLRAVPPPPPVVSASPAVLARSEALVRALRQLEEMFGAPRRPPPGPPPGRPPPRAG